MPETGERQRLSSGEETSKHRRSSSSASEDRASMVSYWKRNSNPNLESMMLDTNADKINRFEYPEILECLPDLDGKRVLELGAGIGRFTKTFAQLAKSVVAVDFMESFLEKNKQENSHYGTVEFLHKDATQLSFESNSFDIVFSNWLFMYLSDQETEQLLQKSLSWLTPNGTLFFRESCFHSSGNIKPAENPTHYRSPRQYIDMCQSRMLSSTSEEAHEQVYELVFAKALESYYEIKNNNNQVCFLFTKTKLQNHNGYKTLQYFLDHS
jgi:phosphoethanolamine N-methyltransferase